LLHRGRTFSQSQQLSQEIRGERRDLMLMAQLLG
jgi:hypothetical protein